MKSMHNVLRRDDFSISDNLAENDDQYGWNSCVLTALQYNKKIYRKYYIRNSGPGFLRLFIVFPCFTSAFRSKSKKCPEPGPNLHISYHTAEP